MNSIFDPFRGGMMIGFDPVFNVLSDMMNQMAASNKKANWPPYNLVKLYDHAYQLQVALAGFTKDEIEVYREGDYLVIVGHVEEPSVGYQVIHQGIAMRNFLMKFLIADYVDVNDVEMDGGMLKIKMARNTPVTPNHIDYEIRLADPTKARSVTKSVGTDQPPDVMQEMQEASSEN